MTQDLKRRYDRQKDLIPADIMAKCRALVIGVGAIGRQVALQLAAIGMPYVSLYDFDTVEVENLAPQGFRPDQLGMTKVAATGFDVKSINEEVDVRGNEEQFTAKSVLTLMKSRTDKQTVVFCCVDSIETRGDLFDMLRDKSDLFIDARMSAETIRVLGIEDPSYDRYYKKTIFTSAEAHQGSCTAKSTIYTANIAAGLMISQFTKWLRGMPTDRDVLLNLLSMDLVTEGLQNDAATSAEPELEAAVPETQLA